RPDEQTHGSLNLPCNHAFGVLIAGRLTMFMRPAPWGYESRPANFHQGLTAGATAVPRYSLRSPGSAGNGGMGILACTRGVARGFALPRAIFFRSFRASDGCWLLAAHDVVKWLERLFSQRHCRKSSISV